MRIGIMGTGSVGRTLASKLTELDHEVRIGTRDVKALLGRTERGADGSLPFAEWRVSNPGVEVGTFEEAAAGAEVVINATSGSVSLDALRAAGEANLGGKVLIDVSNALDFSHGMPPTLAVANTDSVAERIQRAFPGARVVKTLNTVTAGLMVAPAHLADGAHTMFVAGNDPQAKADVERLLREGFGWKDVVDAGDITAARGLEMYFALWFHLFRALGDPVFNVALVTMDPRR
jgi:predicted dinucleotide-binding enzyme